MSIGTLTALLMLACAGCGGDGMNADAPEPTVLVLRNGTLLDGSGGPAIENALVVARGESIVAAGAAADLEIPAGAEVIDAGGGWIVPGFIDNHVHLARASSLHPWLKTGVTTVVDNGSTIAPDALRSRFPGALSCGAILTAPRGYPRFDSDRSPALEYTSEDEVVRYLDDARPDCVKLAIERGFLADYDDEGWPVLTPEQASAIVAAGKARGLSVRAHLTQPGELAVALDAGVEVIAHTPIEPIPDSLLRRAAAARVIFVTTAALWNDPVMSGAAANNLARYVAIGGRIAIGSDYPNLPEAGLPMDELRLLEAAGVPAAALFAALTRDGAAAVGRSDLGVIAPGARADFLVLRDDPRESVEAFSAVRIVVRGGAIAAP